MPCIPSELHQSIILALVTSRLDNYNALYLNINSVFLSKLHVVECAEARLILNIP